MKLSRLLELTEASMERWGDIECYLHPDEDSEYFMQIEDIVGEYAQEDEDNPILVFAAYRTRAPLTLVV